MIARIFLDDKSRDSWDYNNNYIYFNENDEETKLAIINILKNEDTSNLQVRRDLQEICTKSFSNNFSYERKNTYYFNELVSIARKIKLYLSKPIILKI